jgi:ankyrin repeat protein
MKRFKLIFIWFLILSCGVSFVYGIRWLIDDIEYKRIERMDPHEVIRGGSKLLILAAFTKVGLNPNVLDSNGENVLFEAVRGGDPEIVAALVKSGADVNLVNKNGESLRDVASKLTAADEISRILFRTNEPQKPTKISH